MPLHLTAKERSTLATIVALLALGLIGMAVLRDEPARAKPTTESARPVQPRP